MNSLRDSLRFACCFALVSVSAAATIRLSETLKQLVVANYGYRLIYHRQPLDSLVLK
jgi:hypothetical protein